MSDEESVQTVPQNADGDVYRAVIYCRVSTDDKGQTNENQEFMCRKWCDAHGYEVVDVYRDTITGTTIIRPGLNMMIARIKSERDVDYIVAYDQSRITRGEDPKNNFDAVKDLLAGSRCRFRFVLMDVDDSNIAGKILGDLNTRINAQENKLRSERTKAALMKLKSDGKHVGRPARFLIAGCPVNLSGEEEIPDLLHFQSMPQLRRVEEVVLDRIAGAVNLHVTERRDRLKRPELYIQRQGGGETIQVIFPRRLALWLQE